MFPRTSSTLCIVYRDVHGYPYGGTRPVEASMLGSCRISGIMLWHILFIDQPDLWIRFQISNLGVGSIEMSATLREPMISYITYLILAAFLLLFAGAWSYAFRRSQSSIKNNFKNKVAVKMKVDSSPNDYFFAKGT